MRVDPDFIVRDLMGECILIPSGEAAARYSNAMMSVNEMGKRIMELLPRVEPLLAGKSRDEAFEFPLVYGQSLYYLPDLGRFHPLPLPEGYQYRLLAGGQVKELRARPVVAHPERYEFVQDDPSVVYEWKRNGYEVQVNKGSFLGRFGRKAQDAAYALLNHNLVTAVASDAHSPMQRTTCMSDAYGHLLQSYPKDYLDALFTENPRYICSGLRPIRFRRIPFRTTY